MLLYPQYVSVVRWPSSGKYQTFKENWQTSQIVAQCDVSFQTEGGLVVTEICHQVKEINYLCLNDWFVLKLRGKIKLCSSIIYLNIQDLRIVVYSNALCDSYWIMYWRGCRRKMSLPSFGQCSLVCPERLRTIARKLSHVPQYMSRDMNPGLQMFVLL